MKRNSNKPLTMTAKKVAVKADLLRFFNSPDQAAPLLIQGSAKARSGKRSTMGPKEATGPVYEDSPVYVTLLLELKKDAIDDWTPAGPFPSKTATIMKVPINAKITKAASALKPFFG